MKWPFPPCLSAIAMGSFWAPIFSGSWATTSFWLPITPSSIWTQSYCPLPSSWEFASSCSLWSWWVDFTGLCCFRLSIVQKIKFDRSFHRSFHRLIDRLIFRSIDSSMSLMYVAFFKIWFRWLNTSVIGDAVDGIVCRVRSWRRSPLKSSKRGRAMMFVPFVWMNLRRGISFGCFPVATVSTAG